MIPAEEAQVTNLADYREEVDRGGRASIAMLFDGMGPDPKERPLDDDEVQLIGSELMDARGELFAAAKVCDRTPSRHLHARIMAVVDEIDRIQSDLAGHGAA